MIPTNVKDIMKKLLDAGFEAFLVGGSVRDIILGVVPHDYDVFTNAPAEKILEIFPKGRVIGSEERQKKILTVIVGDVEVSRYRGNGDRTEYGESLEEHTKTCDFTINSIAMTINGNLVDYQGGMLDIKNNIIRAVGNPHTRFQEDLLRVLRLVRFQLKYNMTIETSTMMATHEYVEKFIELPAERLRDELLKILGYGHAVQRLIDYNILQVMIPEIRDLCIEGGDMHAETVIQHSVNAFEYASKVTDNILLRFACFLHDIGKGQTLEQGYKQIQPHLCEFPDQCELCVKDGVHFYEHDRVGEEIADAIMKRLKFSTDDMRYVKTLIRSHMFSFKQDNGNISKKTYAKFFAKIESANIPIEDYVILLYSDHQGNQAKPRIKFGDFIKGNWLHKKYYEMKHEREPFTVKDLDINGRDLMELGLNPGLVIGETLERLFDEVMDGNIKNFRPELMNAAKNLIKEVKQK